MIEENFISVDAGPCFCSSKWSDWDTPHGIALSWSNSSSESLRMPMEEGKSVVETIYERITPTTTKTKFKLKRMRQEQYLSTCIVPLPFFDRNVPFLITSAAFILGFSLAASANFWSALNWTTLIVSLASLYLFVSVKRLRALRHTSRSQLIPKSNFCWKRKRRRKREKKTKKQQNRVSQSRKSRIFPHFPSYSALTCWINANACSVSLLCEEYLMAGWTFTRKGSPTPMYWWISSCRGRGASENTTAEARMKWVRADTHLFSFSLVSLSSSLPVFVAELYWWIDARWWSCNIWIRCLIDRLRWVQQRPYEESSRQAEEQQSG